jgi:hypothetical protein
MKSLEAEELAQGSCCCCGNLGKQGNPRDNNIFAIRSNQILRGVLPGYQDLEKRQVQRLGYLFSDGHLYERFCHIYSYGFRL